MIFHSAHKMSSTSAAHKQLHGSTNKSTPKAKKGIRFSSNPLNLVRLAGIEPTTPWFVAKYSIQLSYSREKQDYSTAFLIL